MSRTKSAVELAAVALDAVCVELLVGAPDPLRREIERRPADGVRELLDVFERRPTPERLQVEGLQRRVLVAVLLDVGAPGGEDVLRLGGALDELARR